MAEMEMKDAETKQQEEVIVGRQPLPYHFEKELFEKENKHFHVVDRFIATNKVFPIEGKFYARHQQELPVSEKYLKFTERTQSKRRTKTDFPLLESQVYGWLPQGINYEDLVELNFLCAVKQRCCMTKHGEKLCSERVTERPPFNGLRFFLQ